MTASFVMNILPPCCATKMAKSCMDGNGLLEHVLSLSGIFSIPHILGTTQGFLKHPLLSSIARPILKPGPQVGCLA